MRKRKRQSSSSSSHATRTHKNEYDVVEYPQSSCMCCIQMYSHTHTYWHSWLYISWNLLATFSTNLIFRCFFLRKKWMRNAESQCCMSERTRTRRRLHTENVLDVVGGGGDGNGNYDATLMNVNEWALSNMGMNTFDFNENWIGFVCVYTST